MTGFARCAAAGLLAAVFGISMLAGCTPNNAAVGDTQSAGDAVAHSMKDRNSLDVAMIGSQDEQTDRLALDAMEAGGVNCIDLYAPNPKFRSNLGRALRGRRAQAGVSAGRRHGRHAGHRPASGRGYGATHGQHHRHFGNRRVRREP